MIEHPGDLKPGDRVVLTVTRIGDAGNVWLGGHLFVYDEWLRVNADLLPEPLPPRSCICTADNPKTPACCDQHGLPSDAYWLGVEAGTEGQEPAVDVNQLRTIAMALRKPGCYEIQSATELKAWIASDIEACLPPAEPPYTDPVFHPGMLVQAEEEDGTGPLWLYLPASADDPEPFWSISERGGRWYLGAWSSRRKLPDHLRVVYIDSGGQVRPVKEAGE